MKTYFAYVQDDRYTVSNFFEVTAADDGRVRDWAAERLLTSPHYQMIEIYEADVLICSVSRDQLGRGAAERP